MKRALWLVLVACGPRHVQLVAPRPDLGPHDRVAMFMQRKPVNQKVVEISTNGGPWELDSTSLVLADGTEVVAPEDLLPVVGPDSETARAARASVAARHHERIAWAGLIAATVGTMVFGVGMHLGPDGIEAGDPPVPSWIGWSVGVGSMLTAALFEKHYHHVEIDDRKRAFAHYTRDLGDRLNVCARGLQVVPCDGPLPPDPGPAATAPR